MQSVYLQSSPNTALPPLSADGVASEHLLHAIWWISRHWVERLAVDAPPRKNLIFLGILTDDLVRAGDYSVDAMTTVRALLCTNCRRLDAAHGKCSGQPLDRCPLLNGPRSPILEGGASL